MQETACAPYGALKTPTDGSEEPFFGGCQARGFPQFVGSTWGSLAGGPSVGSPGPPSNDPAGLIDEPTRTSPVRRRCGARSLVLAVDALGVDLEEHVDAVAGPLGDLGRRDARVEPGGPENSPRVGARKLRTTPYGSDAEGARVLDGAGGSRLVRVQAEGHHRLVGDFEGRTNAEE